MKFPSAVILTSLAAFARLAAATPETRAPIPAEQPAKDVDTLVRELADDSFRVRENATRDLWEMGESALPAIKEAAASNDPEQAFRARDLLRKVQLHITPETDPSVIALVERYVKASISEKTALLGKMKGKRAWRQMLKLYASETTPEAREKLKPSINGVALRAARERIYNGDTKSAREFLEMAPADAQGLLALAEFHRSQGTLDAELNRAQALKGRAAAAWTLALQRAAGNIPAAREAAVAAGETRIAASMAALMGDPLPWLRDAEESSSNDPVAAAYAAVAARRWLGQKVRHADLEPLVHDLNSREVSDRGAAVNAMFLLGNAAIAEPVFSKTSPLEAFGYFESLERIPEAFEALGLDAEKPDYQPWVEKRVAKITANDIEDQHGVSTHSEELVALANFLERRGRLDEAYSVYSGPLAGIAKKDSSPFLDFLGELFGNSRTRFGAPMLAKRIGFDWAGEDEKRWEELITAGFGDDDECTDWWDWLAELDPKASRVDRFDGMMALFGIGPDPLHLREKWFNLAWKAVDAAPAVQRDTLATRISNLCNRVGDVDNSLKAWKILPESARREVFWGARIAQLTAVERWRDAAEVVGEHIKSITEPRKEPSDEIHAYAYGASAYRLAGREDEAIRYDRMADQLTLGNCAYAMRVASGYAYGRDYNRAREWWARAAVEADPDSEEYPTAMELQAESLLEEGRWKEAAAVTEVVARAYTTSDLRGVTTLTRMMGRRLQADMARALSMLKEDRPAAISILAECHRAFISDGTLADIFFPALRKAELFKEHDEWFGKTWDNMQDVIRRYPESDNTLNTAAWLAARAQRNLDDAEKLLQKALAVSPNQSAYLDTMAEVQFAKGDRGKAVEWSRRAVNFTPDDAQYRRQQDRFRSEPLPKR